MNVGFSSTRSKIIYLSISVIAFAIIIYSIVIYCKSITDVIGMIVLLITVPIIGCYTVCLAFKIREGRLSEDEVQNAKKLEHLEIIKVLQRYFITSIFAKKVPVFMVSFA